MHAKRPLRFSSPPTPYGGMELGEREVGSASFDCAALRSHLALAGGARGMPPHPPYTADQQRKDESVFDSGVSNDQ
jgi:hypothetical protein